MNLPTQSQVVAFGRHVVTYAMGGISMLAAVHVLSPTDATTATGAINQISTGVASIIAGVGTLVAIASGVYAAVTASPLWQIFAVAKNPDVKAVITEPTAAGKALALSAPSNVSTAAK